ncbi:MAG: GreA/GreB family elongation factor [Bdellovibrio sp.]|nr:GreA/GreB family elongation factor [Bdellovibrio sp.]
MSGNPIILSQKDYSKLKKIKCFHPGSDYKKLEDEIEHAKIVSEWELPNDVVTMNSQIILLIEGENKKINVTIVYPCDADFLQNKISVLSPLAMMLLGLKVNDVIDWTFPDGTTKPVKILGVRATEGVKVVVH